MAADRFVEAESWSPHFFAGGEGLSNGARQVADEMVASAWFGGGAVCFVAADAMSGAMAGRETSGLDSGVAEAGCIRAGDWGTLSIEPKGVKGRSPQLLRKDSVVIGIATLEM